MKLIILLAVLLGAASQVKADTGQDLALANKAFESVKVTMSTQANSFPEEQRGAIWAQYYLALEHLERMNIHHQMMVQHNQDRSEQILKAYSEFAQALDKLLALLPDPA